MRAAKASAHRVPSQITTATREKLAALGHSAQQVKEMRPDEALAAAERGTAPAAFPDLLQSLREEAAAAAAAPPPVAESVSEMSDALVASGEDVATAPAPVPGAAGNESPSSAPAPALRPQPEAEGCN